MRINTAIVAFAMAGWMAPACSQDAEQNAASDVENRIAQVVEKGGPTESSGIESLDHDAISLEAHFEAMAGSNLRAREVILLPGAKILVHAHDERPTVVYVLEGELVEHRNDSEEPIIRRQGDTYFEALGVVHWAENVSPNRTRAFVVDIVPSEPG